MEDIPMKRIFNEKWELLLGINLMAATLVFGEQPAADGRIWCNADAPVQVNLNAVAAYGKDHALAVGGDGVVLEFRDGRWSRVDAAEKRWNSAALNAVVILGPDNMMIGSAARETAARGVSIWDGEEWGPVVNAAGVNSRQRVHALWGDSQTGVVIAALQSGRVTRWEGGMWSNIISLGKGDLLAVHGSGMDNIWVVGAQGQIHQSTDGGITWRNYDQFAETPYAETTWTGVYTLGPDKTWITGHGGEIAFWDGKTFSVVHPTKQALRAIYAIDENNAYAAGSAPGADRGTLLYYNGKEWRPMKLDASVVGATWRAIACDEEGRLWIVGDNGRVLTSIPSKGAGLLWMLLLMGFPRGSVSRRRGPFRRNAGGGFSLVELLSAIAVLVVLAAIVIGVLMGAKRSADTVICQNNMRSIGLAIVLYVNDHDGYVPGPVSGGQKLGYSTSRASDRYHLPRLVGTYLGLPDPKPEAQFAEAIACPAWLANLGPGADPLSTPAYLAKGGAMMVDGSKATPWGSSSDPSKPPRLLREILDPEKAIALMDIDSTVVGSWPGQIPARPVHAGYQNALYWDFHVEQVRGEEL